MDLSSSSDRPKRPRRAIGRSIPSAFLCVCCAATLLCLSFDAPSSAVRRGLHAIKDAVTEEDTPPYIHPEEHTLVANIGRYPNYVAGKTNPDGWVKVVFHRSSLTLEASLTGLESSVTAGVHIHEGTTCCALQNVDPKDPNAPRDTVGDHYYNRRTRLKDPWTDDRDATYTSLADGSTDAKLLSSGAFHLNQGFTYEENIGHVVVVHDSNGVRVGCGVLRDPTQLNDWEKNRFINGIEACSEEGKEGNIIAKDEEEGTG